MSLCQTCGGSGKVPVLPGLRQQCPIYHSETLHPLCTHASPHCSNCQCQGRGWVPVFPLEEVLIAAEAEGYIIGLVSDDNGHWAAVGDGAQPVPSRGARGIPWTTLDLAEAIWGDSPSEALAAALRRAIEKEEP